MHCKHCGQEINTGSRFCKHCGKEQPSMQAAPASPSAQQPPAPSYQQVNETPELKKRLEEQKAQKREKRAKRMTKAASVMWLIAGILQLLIAVILGLGWTRRLIGFPQTISLEVFSVEILYCRFSSIALISFVAAIIFMSAIGICAFIKRKKRTETLRSNKLLVPIMQSAVQAALLFEVLFFWSEIRYAISYALSLPTLLSDLARPLLFAIVVIGALFAILPAAVDLINAAMIKKKKKEADRPSDTKTKKKIVWLITIIACCFTVVSAALIGVQYIDDKLCEAEKERVINLVKYGHLTPWPDKAIGPTIETAAAKMTPRNSVNLYWEYDPRHPQYPLGADDTMREGLGPEDKLVVARYLHYPTEEFDDCQYVHIVFSLDKDDNVSLKAIYTGYNDENRHDFDTAERADWLDGIFNDGYSRLAIAGEYYDEHGIYVSSTDALYSDADLDKKSRYTFSYSGSKTVYGYKIVYGYGERDYDYKARLWLKVSGNEYYDYMWIPASEYDIWRLEY